MTGVIDHAVPSSALGTTSTRRRRRIALRGTVPPAAAGWKDRYRRNLLHTDVAVLVLTASTAQLLVYGVPTRLDLVALSGPALVLGWLTMLAYFRSRDERLVGTGLAEWRQVVRATGLLIGWTAVAAVLMQWNVSRPFLAMALGSGLAGLLAGRIAWRRWLLAQRRDGRQRSHALLVGGMRSSRMLAERLGGTPTGSLDVTGLWIPTGELPPQGLEVDGRSLLVMDSAYSVVDAVRMSGADTVVVTDTEHLGPDGMRDLSWDLEELGVDLMLSPHVLDVARPRLQVRDVGDAVLLHLAEPRYEGATRLTKQLFDRTLALLAVVALAPVLAVLAVVVKTTSAGPVLFRQVRIGKDGAPIRVWKFRTMHTGAEAQLAALLAAQGGGDRPLFKVEDDPRITRVGAFLRRTSLDELPQFFNVLAGTMSIVGPRPQVPAEVALYGQRDHYRLRVRPGITGLWQVSGRSDLPWEDAIKLDIDYVENWSMLRDLQIMWRTVGVVLSRSGAR